MSINFKPLFVVFIVGIALSGIGMGSTVIELSNTKFIHEAPTTNYEYKTKTLDYEITDNLIIDTRFAKFITDESLTNSVKIEVKYYEEILDIVVNKIHLHPNYELIEIDRYDDINKSLIDLFLKNLKDKKIYDYSKLYNYEVLIYTSSENINKLNNNINNYITTEKEYEYNYYNETINDLYNQIHNLENKINDLESEKVDLENENNELKDKIDNYKNNLQNIFD